MPGKARVIDRLRLREVRFRRPKGNKSEQMGRFAGLHSASCSHSQELTLPLLLPCTLSRLASCDRAASRCVFAFNLFACRRRINLFASLDDFSCARAAHSHPFYGALRDLRTEHVPARSPPLQIVSRNVPFRCAVIMHVYI